MATGFQSTAYESIPREIHPESGSQVTQLTSAPAISDHIYCEVPYMDPASRYIIYVRKHDSVGPTTLWRADLERNYVTRVSDPLQDLRGIGVSPDQRYFYCLHRTGERSFEILRLDIATLEEEQYAFEDQVLNPRTMGSVTPDLRYYINSAYLGDGRFGILRFDLLNRTHAVIWNQDHEMCNAHPQIDPGGTDIMIQHNRDSIIDETGRMVRPFGEIGKTIYLIDINGQNHRTLPWGKPYTWPTQGHQCWIGKTHGILSTVSGGPREQLAAEGNILALWPDADAPVPVGKGFFFVHPNASRDGRFWTSDERPGGRIIVGSFKTAKCRVLCESHSSFSRPQYSHPHPYFSPDSKWVIFNSDRTGVPQVYAATVPDGLLESLE